MTSFCTKDLSIVGVFYLTGSTSVPTVVKGQWYCQIAARSEVLLMASVSSQLLFLVYHGSLALPKQSCLLLCYSLEEFLPRNLLFKSASVPAFPRRANIANLSPFTLGNPILFDGLCCALRTCLQCVLFQAHHSLPIPHLCILPNLQ